MLERERHNLILKLIEERSIVSVTDLLDLLGASEAKKTSSKRSREAGVSSS